MNEAGVAGEILRRRRRDGDGDGDGVILLGGHVGEDELEEEM